MTEPPDLDWRDGSLPVSRRHADPYYAPDGPGESRHVFLDGNDLAARMSGARAFRTAELGFGTGLNFLAALELWRRVAAPGGTLCHVAFEIAPLSRGQLARALSRWSADDGIAPLAARLAEVWAGPGSYALPGARLMVIGGDARATVPVWEGTAQAWFLDGFAPRRNPEMWEPALLGAVFAATVPGGTAATYAAAGAVRRGLAGAGFEVARRPGFGPKRDMTVARRPDRG